MDNNEQTTQETNNATDTDTNTEQHQGTQTDLETDAATEPADDNIEGSQSEPEPDSPQTTPDDKHLNAIKTVNQNLESLQEQFDKHIARNQTQQKLFDKFYQEMEANKEDALFEAYQKPVINNLIQLYDSLVGVEGELESICKNLATVETENEVVNNSDEKQNADIIDPFEALEKWFESFSKLKQNKQKSIVNNVNKYNQLFAILESFWKVPRDKQPSFQKDLLTFQNNFKIVRLELEEVLYRMNVTPNDEPSETGDKLNLELHTTVDTKVIADEKLDKCVAEMLRIGFNRSKKDQQGQEQKQVIRREEVIIYRYEPSSEEPEETTADIPANEPEETASENKTSGSEEPVDGN